MDIETLLRANSVCEDNTRIRAVEERLFSKKRQLTPDHIEIAEQVGRGAFGTVYRARDRKLDRQVAIKVIKFSTALEKQRLDREARALARLNHPNIIQLYESGEAGPGVYFLSLEYVEGQPLTTWLRARPRTTKEILRVFLAVTKGLFSAHQRSLVHRDLKPDHIVICRDGTPKILDFGLAKIAAGLRGAGDDRPSEEPMVINMSHIPTSKWRSVAANVHEDAGQHSEPPPPKEANPSNLLAMPLTETGGILGTPAYASPEQLRGEETDARSDQFSLSAVMFEAICGFHPFDTSDTSRRMSITHRLRAIESGTIVDRKPASAVPRWLRQLLHRGLSANPDDRYDDLRVFIDKLEAKVNPVARPIRNAMLGAIGISAIGALIATSLWIASTPLRWQPSPRMEEPTIQNVLSSNPSVGDFQQRWESVAEDIHARWRLWNRLEDEKACMIAINHAFNDELDRISQQEASTAILEQPRVISAQFLNPQDCLDDEFDIDSFFDALAVLQQAHEQHREGRYDDAIATLDRIPDHAMNSQLQGLASYQRGEAMLKQGKPQARDALTVAQKHAQMSGTMGTRLFKDATLRLAESGLLLDRPDPEIEFLLFQISVFIEKSGLGHEAQGESQSNDEATRFQAWHDLLQGHLELRNGNDLLKNALLSVEADADAERICNDATAKYRDAIKSYSKSQIQFKNIESDNLAAFIGLQILPAEQGLYECKKILQSNAGNEHHNNDNGDSTRRLAEKVKKAFNEIERQYDAAEISLPLLAEYTMIAATVLNNYEISSEARIYYNKVVQRENELKGRSRFTAIWARAELLLLDMKEHEEETPEDLEELSQDWSKRAEKLSHEMEAMEDLLLETSEDRRVRVWSIIEIAVKG